MRRFSGRTTAHELSPKHFSFSDFVCPVSRTTRGPSHNRARCHRGTRSPALPLNRLFTLRPRATTNPRNMGGTLLASHGRVSPSPLCFRWSLHSIRWWDKARYYQLPAVWRALGFLSQPFRAGLQRPRLISLIPLAAHSHDTATLFPCVHRVSRLLRVELKDAVYKVDLFGSKFPY